MGLGVELGAGFGFDCGNRSGSGGAAMAGLVHRTSSGLVDEVLVGDASVDNVVGLVSADAVEVSIFVGSEFRCAAVRARKIDGVSFIHATGRR